MRECHVVNYTTFSNSLIRAVRSCQYSAIKMIILDLFHDALFLQRRPVILHTVVVLDNIRYVPM